MGRGNGNLLFNLALILIFCHLSKQPVCCRSRGKLGEGLTWQFKDWRTPHTGQGLGGGGTSWGVTAGRMEGVEKLPVKILFTQKEALSSSCSQSTLSRPKG